MSYELRHGTSIGENLRRICRKQIDVAIEISTGRQTCQSSPVHETRRHLKKARAALRLACGEMHRAVFQEQDDALRNAGRLISEIRDAEVRLQTVRELQEIGRQRNRFAEVEAVLTMELQNFLIALAQWHSEAMPFFESAKSAIPKWPVEGLGTDQLRAAVQRSYRRARKALNHANSVGTAEQFHRFRTRAKMLCYHLRILRPINSVVLRELSEELGAVAALLGRAHDLNFLGERLRHHAGKEEWQRETEQLLPLVQVSEQDLQGGAAALAEHFFAERPRVFASRFGDWLENWQHNHQSSFAGQLI